jgi:hypothetical protein
MGPSQLILTEEYKLGLQDASGRGSEFGYIVRWDEPQPSDQTDLRDTLDDSLEAMEEYCRRL